MAERRRLLLLNPNTSADLTRRLVTTAAALAPELDVQGRSGGFGARIITTRTELAIAGHAVVDALTEPPVEADAVILAVSFDVGLAAARALLPVPVLGITEAALLLAVTMGRWIGIAAFGTRCLPLYRELAARYGLAGRIAGYVPVELPPAGVYADPTSADAAVADAARTLVARDAAEVVVVTGAAMAGVPARIRDRVPVPVLDGLSCAVQLASARLALTRRAPDL